MRIFAVNPIQFNNSKRVQKGNWGNFESKTLPSLNCPKDTVSFQGKIPSLVTPTMEDLVNRTKAVDILRYNILRLAKHKVPCPCCGHIMLDIDTYKAFESDIQQTTNPQDILIKIGKLKEYLHPVEMSIYKMMKAKSFEHPDMSLHEMLKEKLPRSEKKLIFQQSKILVSLGVMSKKLPSGEGNIVSELIGETFQRLFDTRSTSRFSRKVFLKKLEDILKNTDNVKLKNKIISAAAELPTAYNNTDSFIVKYAKRDYKGKNPDQKIACRMLANSLATVEHIRPQKKGGAMAPENLALECACDNNRRNHDSVIEQVLENPTMIINYRLYMDRLSELHLAGKLEKAYITQTNKSYAEASDGLLFSDLSLLKNNSQLGVKPTRTLKDGRTPTKSERREIRKQHLKLKRFKKNNPKEL